MQVILSNTYQRTAVRWLMIFCLLTTTWVVLQPVPLAIAKVFGNETAENQSQGHPKNDQRMREDTKVEKLEGHFKLTGDRVTFFTATTKQRIGGLENLTLERIARTVKDSPTPLRWIVSGVITEYRGANYLLVTHAVLTEDIQGFDRR